MFKSHAWLVAIVLGGADERTFLSSRKAPLDGTAWSLEPLKRISTYFVSGEDN